MGFFVNNNFLSNATVSDLCFVMKIFFSLFFFPFHPCSRCVQCSCPVPCGVHGFLKLNRIWLSTRDFDPGNVFSTSKSLLSLSLDESLSTFPLFPLVSFIPLYLSLAYSCVARILTCCLFQNESYIYQKSAFFLLLPLDFCPSMHFIKCINVS